MWDQVVAQANAAAPATPAQPKPEHLTWVEREELHNVTDTWGDVKGGKETKGVRGASTETTARPCRVRKFRRPRIRG
jgi:hypothetical protein